MKPAADVEDCKINAGLKRLLMYFEPPRHIIQEESQAPAFCYELAGLKYGFVSLLN